MFVALVIQHAMRMCHIVPVAAWICNIFPHYFINGTILEKEGTEQEMCVRRFSTTFV
jgi:putative copper export protein